MADDTGQSGRSGGAGGAGDAGGESHNPWAPPGNGVPLGKGPGEADRDRQRKPLADQPTITSASGGAVPPPVPPAPGGAARGPGQPSGAGYGSYGKAPGYGQQPGGQPYGSQQYGGPQYGGPQYGHPGPGPAYGYPAAPQPYGHGTVPGGYGWPGSQPPNGKSVAAMVVGIISMVAVASCWGSFLAILTSPVALGLGLSARRGVDRGELSGRGQATAGFVMGIVGTILSAVIITIIVLTFTVFQNAPSDPDTDPGTGGDGSSLDARGAGTLVG